MYYSKEYQIFLDGEWVKAQDGKTNLYSQTLHYGEFIRQKNQRGSSASC